MENVPDFPPDSSQKPPRKRSRKQPPTVAELQEQYETAREQLRVARQTERQGQIVRLGMLAHKVGLAVHDTATLQREFLALAKRLAGTVVLTLALLSGGCQPHPSPSTHPDTLTQFTRGQTTYAEVVQALGPPSVSSLKADGTRQLVYRSTTNNVQWHHFVPGVSMFVPRTTDQSTLTLDFDTQGVLSTFTTTQESTTVSPLGLR